ncbi:hypothetical protein QJS04_geneDACA021157 [Acorus gramineus]|uniref:Uncharacterized protein n=1 Tax=Acorus gramineus TaxID=55184 RepID=A0AAV9ADC3_ACOGR|nr:hypothetical protein QJS04_geneDACA021157 [Acorus gramineus]
MEGVNGAEVGGMRRRSTPSRPLLFPLSPSHSICLNAPCPWPPLLTALSTLLPSYQWFSLSSSFYGVQNLCFFIIETLSVKTNQKRTPGGFDHVSN